MTETAYSSTRPFWKRWYHTWLDRNKPPVHQFARLNVRYLLVSGALEVMEPTR